MSLLPNIGFDEKKKRDSMFKVMFEVMFEVIRETLCKSLLDAAPRRPGARSLARSIEFIERLEIIPNLLFVFRRKTFFEKFLQTVFKRPLIGAVPQQPR